MSPEEVQASLFLNNIQEIGPARFQSLMKKFFTAVAAVRNGPESWSSLPLFDPETITQIKTTWENSRVKAANDFCLVEKKGARLYFWQEGPYPELLKQITYPPPVLYGLGNDISLEQTAIALVGSRRCTYYGEKMAVKIAAGLADAGVITISGLARGIDTFVHRSTLEAGGATWAVIGSGLAALYPPENKKLAEEIQEKGALISEFPMATRPFPGHFPRRNRIIAGLSRGTVIIEGGAKSGSLITARLAAEEGRDVFAVPGPVTSELSAAPHMLLKMGAAMVQCAADILVEIGMESMGSASLSTEKKSSLPGTYKALLAFLSEDPVPKEILAQRLKQDVSRLSSLLLEMELKGLIRSVPGGGVLKA